MKLISEARMRDIAAAIAVRTADVLPEKEDRVQSVADFLRCDQDEARALISRGRRIARDKAKPARRARNAR